MHPLCTVVRATPVTNSKVPHLHLLTCDSRACNNTCTCDSRTYNHICNSGISGLLLLQCNLQLVHCSTKRKEEEEAEEAEEEAEKETSGQ